MSLPATEPHRSYLAATGWALAGGACAGGLWAAGLVVNLTLLNVILSPASLARTSARDALVMALGGAVSGLVVGLVCGGIRRGVPLGLTGTFIGAVAGGLCIPTMRLCARWMHPLASSTLLWAVVGLFAGLLGYRYLLPAKGPAAPPRGSVVAAAGWALAAALCAGGPWAAVMGAAWVGAGIDFPPIPLDLNLTLMFLALCAGSGLLVGAALAFRGRPGERTVAVLVLCSGGGVFGALAGGLSILAVVAAGDRLHPLVSSSLAVASAGFLAGLCGYAWSRPTVIPAEPLEEAADHPPAAKVEWLLVEPKRPWRIDRALGRVLPVLAAAVAALVGAALTAPVDAALALLAVGVLGLAVAAVLFRQEKRLDALERRLRGRG